MTPGQLQRYLDNNCTPAEKKTVEQWLLTASEEAIDVVMQERWRLAGGQMPAAEKDALWRQLTSSIQPVRKRALVRWLPVRARIAAAAAVLVLASLVAFWLNSHKGWKEMANNSPLAKQVNLPDGSTVWLNGWSTLSCSDHFNEQKREVKISGEAYFVVKEDKTKPFIVYAGDIAARVLGTEFNVEAYAGEAAVKVSLNKGKVAVTLQDKDPSRADPVKYLQPGQMLVHTKDRKLSVQPIAVQKVQAWAEGYFVANDINLSEMLKRLEKRYGIRFHIEGDTMPATACEHVASTFAGESWQQIVKQLCFTCHFTYSIQGQDIFLQYAP